jgi:hypothetical protein
MATAHLIGYALHRLTGLPWVADFRDPMTEIDPDTKQKFPTDSRLYRVRHWIENLAIRNSQRAVFVTSGALKLYRERYPERASDMRLVANGFDEQGFVAAEKNHTARTPSRGPLELVHSGTLYPGPDRDANGLLEALAQLRQAGRISPETIRVRLRATGYDDYYRERIAHFGVGDLVTLETAIPYHAALAEMLDADGLLLFQGSTSNPAIPAKLYEYLRARRPIFAMVDERGETAAVLRNAGVGTRVPFGSSQQIAAGLLQFLDEVRNGTAPVASESEISLHSRKHKALEMAQVFQEIIPDPAQELSQEKLKTEEALIQSGKT